MRQKGLIYILLLIISTLLIYAHTSSYGFLNWDDNKDILNKPRIEELSVASVIHLFNPLGIFKNQYFYEYFPVTDLTYMIEWHFYGENFPQGFHIDNTLLQLINVLLIFFSLKILIKNYLSKDKTQKLKNPGETGMYNADDIAFVSAMIFAVSPMMVETVTWLSCRKDLLLLLFYLLWFIAYMTKRYTLSFIMFILAILSKFQGVTIPGVLVAYEVFIVRTDIKGVIKRLVPYLAVLCLYVPYTMWYYNKGQTAFVDKMGVIWTIMFIPEMLFIYIRKLFLPFGLVPVYTVPTIKDTCLFSVSLIFFLILVAWIIKLFKGRRYLYLFGVSWFLFNLVPVSNIISLPTKIADRYVYEASVGVFFITSICFFTVIYQKNKNTALIVSAIILTTLMYLSYKQTLYWKDNITIWTHTLDYQPDSYTAWNNIGTEYKSRGDTHRAVYSFGQALKYNPDFVPALWNLGSYYLLNGEYDKALPLFMRMCKIASRQQYLGCRAAGAIYLKYYNQPSTAKILFEQSYKLAPDQPGVEELKNLIHILQ